MEKKKHKSHCPQSSSEFADTFPCLCGEGTEIEALVTVKESEIATLRSQKAALLAACVESLKYIELILTCRYVVVMTTDYLSDNPETPRITELLKSAIEQAGEG